MFRRDVDGSIKPALDDTLWRIGSRGGDIDGVIERLERQGRPSFETEVQTIPRLPVDHVEYPDVDVVLRERTGDTASIGI